MLKKITLIIKYVILSIMAKITDRPQIQIRHKYIKYLYNYCLGDVARDFNLPKDLLQQHLKSGIDNPAYRFTRDKAFYIWLDRNRNELKGSSWLDVGADVGCVSRYLSEYFQSSDMELIDVIKKKNTIFPVKIYDGSTLKYPNDSFDIVIFSYVLHHAADDTIRLLQDARKIARKFVIILEDNKDTKGDLIWAFRHDKSGTFRGLKEWRNLFKTIGFNISEDLPLSSEIHSRHFFLLGVNK